MLKTYWPAEEIENIRWGEILGKWIWGDAGRPIRDCQTMIVFDDNEVRAVVAYHNWEPDDGVIEVSAAARGRWLTAGVLHEMYAYPYNFLNCQLVVQRNEAENDRLNSQLRRLGFSEYRIPRLRGRDKDGIIFTLTAEDWRAGNFSKPTVAAQTGNRVDYTNQQIDQFKDQSHVRQKRKRTEASIPRENSGSSNWH